MMAFETAIDEMLRGLPAPPLAPEALPFTLEVDALAGTRVADVFLLLGLIAVFWGLGRFLKSAGMERLRPFVFASGLTGILLLFFTNSSFWLVKGVVVEQDRVVVSTHLGNDDAMTWSEVRGVEARSGKLFPAFTDDASLVLLGPDDRELVMPRFVPGIERAVAVVRERLRGKVP